MTRSEGMDLALHVLLGSHGGAGPERPANAIPPPLLGHRLGRAATCSSWVPPAHTVERLLGVRETVRSFSAAPVPAASIGLAIDAGLAADRELFADEVAAGVDLELIVIAWSAHPLQPGVHVREDGSLRWVKPPPDRSTPGSVALQREFQEAPLLILAAGNLLASCARHGDHGYRLMLTRAAVASHTAWLRALDEGLQGAIFMGFQPAAARYVLGTSMVRRQLVALALGYHNTASVSDHDTFHRE